MKLQIISDLHLEFNDFEPVNTGADILCLAGDTCVVQHLYRHPVSNLPNNAEKAHLAARYRKFFDKISKMYKTILMVLGNHEHYSGRWNNTAAHLREALEPWDNITLLDDGWLNFGKTRIVGTSLWTNMNKGDPLTMMHIKNMMNDYHAITIERNGVYHKLRPIDTFEAHNRAVETIKLAAETWAGDVVVLGHHAPSFQSVHERYKHDWMMNGGYVSDLDDFILSQEKIKYFIHGHVHNSFDYMIGQCRVVCNPHGYGNENITNFDPNLVIDV
jgi:Icc-related predicted phosphoesterase